MIRYWGRFYCDQCPPSTPLQVWLVPATETNKRTFLCRACLLKAGLEPPPPRNKSDLGTDE